jgi:hypothetical protein
LADIGGWGAIAEAKDRQCKYGIAEEERATFKT